MKHNYQRQRSQKEQETVNAGWFKPSSVESYFNV